MRDLVVELPEITTAECPVSLIARYPEIESLLSDIREAEVVKEATGAFPFGPDTTKWPGRWHDAVRISRIESERFDRECANVGKHIS